MHGLVQTMTKYVTTNPNRRAYHTDPTCANLQQARGVREANPVEIECLTECNHCKRLASNPSGGSRSHYNALRRAAQND